MIEQSAFSEQYLRWRELQVSPRPDSCPECGCVLTKSRSGPDHRRFFGLVAKAFDQWPEGGFVPRDPEHLRAYLLVKVGHTNIRHIPYPDGCEESPALKVLFRLTVESTGKALEDEAGFIDYRLSSGGVEVITSRSIDFRTVGQKAFGPIREAVEAEIERVIGVNAEQLLRSRAA